MSSELVAVIFGAVIGAFCSMTTTVLLSTLKNRQRANSIKAVAAAEVMAIMEKAQRYIDGQSSKEELKASTPMLISIASEIGFLTPKQVIAFRRAVTLDMEMRQSEGNEKAKAAIEACRTALGLLKIKSV